MPPKGNTAKPAGKTAAPEKKKEEVVAAAVASPVPAVPAPVVIAPNSGKTTVGFSYKAMLTKSTPAVAAPKAEAAAEATKVAAAAPTLVDLPASKSEGKKGKKGQKAESAVVAAEAVADAAPVVADVPEPTPAAEVEIVAAAVAVEAIAEPEAETEAEVTAVEEREPTPPQLVVEGATPTTMVIPASPEKMVADEAEVVQDVVSEPVAPVVERMNWADSEPVYSTFDSHFESAVVSSAPAALSPAATSFRVSFRDGSTPSERYLFVAPTNDKMITNLMAMMRSREDELAHREDELARRVAEVEKREIAVRENQNTLATERRAVEDEKRRLSELSRNLETLSQQQQQQQSPPQQQQPRSTQSYGVPHHHHQHQHHQLHQPTSYPMSGYPRPGPQQQQQQQSYDPQFGFGGDYSQPMVPQQRGYGRPTMPQGYRGPRNNGMHPSMQQQQQFSGYQPRRPQYTDAPYPAMGGQMAGPMWNSM